MRLCLRAYVCNPKTIALVLQSASQNVKKKNQIEESETYLGMSINIFFFIKKNTTYLSSFKSLKI